MRSVKSTRAVLAAFAISVGIAGCASSGGGGGAPRSNQNRVVRADLVDVDQLDAYQAIQRLRPQWLRSRGSGDPVLYVDGARRNGGLNELRTIRVADIDQMEYMSSSDASVRFGTGHQGGAILLQTRR